MLPIISIDDILQIIRQTQGDVDLRLITQAYDFAVIAHEGQKRKSGEDYIQHPLYTAKKLAELRMDLPTIAAGILHDVPEDTAYSLDDIKRDFGKEVAKLVEGITKLGTLKYRGLERYAENLRKMLLAMATDIRVIIIKFADRLHNLQTLEHNRPDKRSRIALETIEIYAPIANRLGMDQIQGELEDLAFPFAYPKEYDWAYGLVRHKLEVEKKYIEQIKKITYKELVKEGLEINSVEARVKRYYSTYKKLLRKGKDIDRIYDFIAIRIIVNSVADCYRALGVVHKIWTPLRGRVKDYIAQPKPNGYQSLHTTVFSEKGKIVEFQIRDATMHALAEYGVAAHWFYKELSNQKVDSEKTAWIKNLLELQKSLTDNNEYLERIKSDIFKSRIFVFTPKGDVIDLPEEATPVDFAYHIHTDVGAQCSGAMVNDHIAALDTKLRSGDVVEIITNKARTKPSEDWLHFVKTTLARDKIKVGLRSDRRRLLNKLLNK